MQSQRILIVFQEEKCSLPIRSCYNACPRLAQLNMSVVPRQRAVCPVFHNPECLFICGTPFFDIRNAQKPYTTHRLLLGTHTSGQAQDYLQIATVQIPKRGNPATGADKLDRADYDDERGELGGHNLPPTPRIQIIQRINHAGEVNRARYMPQNPDLIATKAVTGEVLIFDRTKHSSEPERGGVCKPDMRLIGQQLEGCPFFLSYLWSCQ